MGEAILEHVKERYPDPEPGERLNYIRRTSLITGTRSWSAFQSVGSNTSGTRVHIEVLPVRDCRDGSQRARFSSWFGASSHPSFYSRSSPLGSARSEPSKSALASGLTKTTVPTPGLGAKPDIDGPVVDDFITAPDPDFVRIRSPFLRSRARFRYSIRAREKCTPNFH